MNQTFHQEPTQPECHPLLHLYPNDHPPPHLDPNRVNVDATDDSQRRHSQQNHPNISSCGGGGGDDGGIEASMAGVEAGRSSHDNHEDDVGDDDDATGSQEEVGASHLDHALLESLFYNEMVMLDAFSGFNTSSPTGGSTPSGFLSHHLAEAATAAAQDANTIAEKEILSDFGVGGTATTTSISASLTQANAPPPPTITPHGVAATISGIPTVTSWHPASIGTAGGAPAHGYPPPPLADPSQQSLLYLQQPQQLQQAQGPAPHQQQPHPHTLYSTTPHHQLQQQYQQYPFHHPNPPQPAHPPSIATTSGAGQSASVALLYPNPQATSNATGPAAGPPTSAMVNHNGNGISTSTNTATSCNSSSMWSNQVMTVVTNATSQYNAPQPSILPPPLQMAPSTEDDSDYDVPAGVAGIPQVRARQLVDQFATLASRLGIELPDTVLQSLTSAAANNDPTLYTNSGGSGNSTRTGNTNRNGTSTIDGFNASLAASARERTGVPASVASSTPWKAMLPSRSIQEAPVSDDGRRVPSDENDNEQSSNTPPTEWPVAPTVIELRRTAEESIAAVTRKRAPERGNSWGSSGSKHPSENDLDDSDDDDDDAATAVTGGNNNTGRNNSNNNSGKPAYSKRRKKPRLSDCESRLAHLQAENEQLKRHLQNVSNKALKFDREKEEAGRRIAMLHQQNAGNDEMNEAVQRFTDMYSDYGVNRQQELSFHLEQLQRLVNPSNFTKMGLWTLGQSNHNPKKNPIAGILVKELTITAQQGRKILDQSEKIRKLCENLKETLALLVKLKALCEQKTRIFQDRMSKCKEILTSKQVVKLILWINEHTELLESVCPGWGTEHIHSKKSAG